MNNTHKHYYRIYDDKLDLVYEASSREEGVPDKLKRLINRSQLFVTVDNIKCYRMLPQIK